MAASKQRKSGGRTPAKSAKAAAPKATKAPKPSGLPVVKNLGEIAAKSPLGRAVSQVGHMKGGGPNADTYFGLTEKGGKAVYAIRKTGQRSGEGGSGSRHIVTLHTVNADGTLSKPLAEAKSVRAGWVNPS